METYDVVIVGAGPSGCRVGGNLGRDCDVLIIDRKKEIGKPIQCTGLVSDRIFDLSGVSKKVVENKLTSSKFFSQSGNFIELKPKTPYYVLDREKFDKELARRAEKNNTEIQLGTEFLDVKRKTDHLETETTKGKIKTKLLVGADGPNSMVAQSTSIPLPDNLVVGVQETFKGDFDPNSSEVWFGPSISPGFFAWVVPESKEWARVGLATPHVSGEYLRKFLLKRFNKSTGNKDKVGGMIRYGLIKTSVSDRVLLVGDAACQMKPITGGGLVYGMIGANIASSACEKSLNDSSFGRDFLKKEYDKKWKEKLYWPIIQGLFVRKSMNQLPEWSLDIGTKFGKFLEPVFNEFLDGDFFLSKY